MEKMYEVCLTAEDKAVLLHLLDSVIGEYMDLPNFIDAGKYTQQLINARRHIKKSAKEIKDV